jgi:Ca2+-binding EF-hand superfamily protein
MNNYLHAAMALTLLGPATIFAQYNERTDRTSSATRSRTDDQNSNDSDQNRSQRYASNARSGSSESWSDWISDWWSGDSGNQQASGGTNDSGRLDHGIQNFIKKHDSNNDDKLSRDELPSQLRSGFEDIDANDDGYLNKGELRQHAERQARRIPVEVTYVWVLDTNRGRMKLHDLQQAYQTLREIDQNSDGEISREEVNARHKKMVSKWINHIFQENDENDDDELTAKEARQTDLSYRFNDLDRNHDGKLSRSELRQSMQDSQSKSNATGGNDSSQSASRDSSRDDRDRR